jgi:hypothetical protein
MVSAVNRHDCSFIRQKYYLPRIPPTFAPEAVFNQNSLDMKKLIFVLVALIGFTACSAPKAYYETKEGKRKQKYYNDIQYGRNAHPKMKF